MSFGSDSGTREEVFGFFPDVHIIDTRFEM
jgi:hypothetical protein